MVLGGRGDLDRRSSKQGRAENRRDYLSHRKSPLLRRLAAGQRTFGYLSAFVIHITSGAADFYDPPDHETASQFVGQRKFSAKYSAGKLTDRVSLEASQLYGLLLADPLQWGRAARVLRESDEEARICNSLDLVARLGANEIVTQERDRARGQLCADRPHRRRQAGLFNEVREFTCTDASAATG